MKILDFFLFLSSWIRILIRNLNADPDPATQINADPEPWPPVRQKEDNSVQLLLLISPAQYT